MRRWKTRCGAPLQRPEMQAVLNDLGDTTTEEMKALCRNLLKEV